MKKKGIILVLFLLFIVCVSEKTYAQTNELKSNQELWEIGILEPMQYYKGNQKIERKDVFGMLYHYRNTPYFIGDGIVNLKGPQNGYIYLKDKGIINGNYEGFLTRAQAAKILVNYFKLEADNKNEYIFNFTDISPKDWFYEDIQTLISLGVLQNNQHIKPNNKLTFNQFKLMYARVLKLAATEEFIKDSIQSKYLAITPINEIETYATHKNKLTFIFMEKILLEKLEELNISPYIFLEKNKLNLKFGDIKSVKMVDSQKDKNFNGLYINTTHSATENVNNYQGDTVLIFLHENTIMEQKYRTFVHEIGHHIGYVMAHKYFDFAEFSNHKNVDKLELITNDWENSKIEAFADSFTEIVIENFKNRTNVGSFKNNEDSDSFVNWLSSISYKKD